MQGEFEWDPKKAEIDRRNHGVSFADATTIFEDPLARKANKFERSEYERK